MQPQREVGGQRSEAGGFPLRLPRGRGLGRGFAGLLPGGFCWRQPWGLGDLFKFLKIFIFF